MPERNTFKVSSEGGRTDYTVRFLGKIDEEKSDLDDHDNINGDTVTGHVNSGTDKIVGRKQIRGVSIQDGFEHASFTYNGRPVSPFHVNQRKLVIRTPADKAPYTIQVDDDAALIGSGMTNWNDKLYAGETKADGEVMGGRDVWYITAGGFESIDSNQPLDARLDGKQVGGDGNPPCGLE
jgi:hypothetical protein